MEATVLYILGFIVVMTLILWMIPEGKIVVISGFFVAVLPKIPLAGMIKAYQDAKNKNGKGKK